MKRFHGLTGWGAMAGALLAGTMLSSGATAADLTPEEVAKVEFFEKKIRPILAASCVGCHSAETNSKGGLRVDDRRRDAVADGGEELLLAGLQRHVVDRHDRGRGQFDQSEVRHGPNLAG